MHKLKLSKKLTGSTGEVEFLDFKGVSYQIYPKLSALRDEGTTIEVELVHAPSSGDWKIKIPTIYGSYDAVVSLNDVVTVPDSSIRDDIVQMLSNPSKIFKDPRLDQIKSDRQKIYGDPKENHENIAKMWVCLLKPYADNIANSKPIPPHVVALMMVALKLCRMQRVYHEDNYNDLINYLSFAQEWQRDHHDEAKPKAS